MGALGGPHTTGPLAHQVHFPDTSLIANDNTDFFQFIEIFPILSKTTLFFPISKALAPFPKYPETALGAYAITSIPLAQKTCSKEHT